MRWDWTCDLLSGSGTLPLLSLLIRKCEQLFRKHLIFCKILGTFDNVLQSSTVSRVFTNFKLSKNDLRTFARFDEYYGSSRSFQFGEYMKAWEIKTILKYKCKYKSNTQFRDAEYLHILKFKLQEVQVVKISECCITFQKFCNKNLIFKKKISPVGARALARNEYSTYTREELLNLLGILFSEKLTCELPWEVMCESQSRWNSATETDDDIEEKAHISPCGCDVHTCCCNDVCSY